ncbi:MAG: alpha/beta fold hydrolase [Pseudomonadota bacterium]
MARLLLVHGAFHGAWCWHRLQPLLAARGHSVAALDLPGNGIDRTPVAEVTFAACVERIADAAAGEVPTVLIGHSMAGQLIGEVAERWPERVRQLIFLAAFVPEAGRSLSDLAADTEPTDFSRGLTFRDGALQLAPDAVVPAFLADCDESARALALSCLVPQAPQPLSGSAGVSAAGFGRVPKAYVACQQDRCIAVTDQRRMAAAADIEFVAELPCGHSPFFAIPEALAEAIDACLGRFYTD